MNKNEFIIELRAHLHLLPKAEVESAISFYSELFDDAQDEAELVRELGSIQQIAKGIIAEYKEQNPSFDDRSEEERAKKENRAPEQQYHPDNTVQQSKAGMGCLGIAILVFTFPIWLPLAIVAFVLLIVAFVLIIFVPAVIFLAFLGSGIWLIFGAVGMLFVAPIYALYNIGKALVLLGICVLLLPASISLIKGGVAFIVRFVQNIVDSAWRKRK